MLLAIVLVAFLVWRRRKGSKDKRQEKMLEKTINKLVEKGEVTDEMIEGNKLLRELSKKAGRPAMEGQVFQNPMFSGDSTVDPLKAKQQPPWQMGIMARSKAEEYLIAHNGNEGDFLVRDSTTTGQYVLSVLVSLQCRIFTYLFRLCIHLFIYLFLFIFSPFQQLALSDRQQEPTAV